ncbi:hypothetical protein DMC30DRAFT_132021 [Rhodotorula diobovata]|uniref:Uncharacterized protein n=1 Tax=Rhodotorula diobovata TaxID=5288 RepID=A0A5C5FLQ0_9BASI|nr:hypothetical protein DMC30DRAFT_132021 [Rhodotorula diobovata]
MKVEGIEELGETCTRHGSDSRRVTATRLHGRDLTGTVGHCCLPGTRSRAFLPTYLCQSKPSTLPSGSGPVSERSRREVTHTSGEAVPWRVVVPKNMELASGMELFGRRAALDVRVQALLPKEERLSECASSRRRNKVSNCSARARDCGLRPPRSRACPDMWRRFPKHQRRGRHGKGPAQGRQAGGPRRLSLAPLAAPLNARVARSRPRAVLATVGLTSPC